MKTLLVNYQLYVVCSQEVEVPDDFELFTEGSGIDSYNELRERLPDLDIWDTLPEGDGLGDVDIYDHLDYVEDSGLNLPGPDSTWDHSFNAEKI